MRLPNSNLPKELAAMLRAQRLLLTQRDTVDKLRKDRASLQRTVRYLVDKHAPDDQKGWWRHETIVFVREEDLCIEKNGMEQMKLPLQRNVRTSDEHAMLTYKRNGNKKALLWIPGLNDSFFHFHVLDRLLDLYDVYAIDLRRCGRARGDILPDMAHDSHDFMEYMEEIDAAMAFINEKAPYEDIVLYGHSTGALIAALYAKNGDSAANLSGCIFNSPFWSFNLPWYSKQVAENAEMLPLAPDTIVQKGGNLNVYSKSLYENFKFTSDLKSIDTLSLSAGWISAVAKVQSMLRRGELALSIPALVLYTEGDSVLKMSDMDNFSDFLCADRTDGHDADYDSMLVEKRNWSQRLGAELSRRSPRAVATPPKRSSPRY